MIGLELWMIFEVMDIDLDRNERQAVYMKGAQVCIWAGRGAAVGRYAWNEFIKFIFII